MTPSGGLSLYDALAAVPAGAGVLLLLALARRSQDVRDALLDAASLWAVLAVLISEGLSAFGWLARGPLLASWLGVGAAAAALWLRRPTAQDEGARSRILRPLGRLDLGDRALLAGAALAIGLVGVVAVLSPPNSWDAMQYHLPRVAHWIENHGLGFYPTHEQRQLHMPPGAELLMLQLHALSGGDRFDNLVQWGAFAATVIGVSAIARELGAGPRGQVVAAVACATIPEGLLAASGAKGDWVLSLWLSALALAALRFAGDPSGKSAVRIGGALGLACLTKGTAYVLAPPFLLALAVLSPWRITSELLRRLPLIALVALAVVAGHYTRTHALYGSPLGPGVESAIPDDPSVRGFRYANETFSPSAVASNVLRNAALHLRSSDRPINEAAERWIGRAIRAIGGDPDDPRTTFFSFAPFRLAAVERREGLLGNPIHAALTVVALIAACAAARRPERRRAAAYALCVLLGFAAFCVVFKWQPLGARLHLPLFALGSAAVGVAIGDAWPAWAARGVGALLLVAAIPAATDNAARSLVPGSPASVLGPDRSRLYFAEFGAAADPYRAAAAAVRSSGCRDVALDLSTEVGAQYEYPLRVLLGADGATRVRQVGVRNRSAAYEPLDDKAPPCAVICVRCAKHGDRMAPYASGRAAPTVFDDVAVFLPLPGRER